MGRTQSQSIDLDARAVARASAPPALVAWLVRAWTDVAGADLRSLALFRIVIAGIVLADLAGRAGNLVVHYTDSGVLPREVLTTQTNPWRWSLLNLNGSTPFVGALFAIAFIAALAMLLGWRTRLATIVVWVLVFSIQMRNPLLSSGADVLLRLLLLSCILLPLAEVWSLDSRRRAPPAEMRVASIVSLGLFLQIAFMYWFTAALKTGGTWREDGTALFYALNAGHVATGIGQWLGGFPSLLEVLTRVALGLEMVAPILLFIPVRTAWFRTIAVFLIMGFQLGILLTFNIGIFPWTSGLCMVCLLPSAFWTWIGARIPRLRGHDASARQSSGFALRPRSVVANLGAALILALALIWNLTSVSALQVPERLRDPGYAIGLNQSWTMFAPTPPWGTEWYVLSGELASGDDVDLLPAVVNGDFDRGAPVSWERPASIATSLYGDKYWRKFFSDIASDSNTVERRAFLAWTCREWNAAHQGDDALVILTMYEVFERTMRDGSIAASEPTQVHAFICATGTVPAARIY